MCTRVPQWSGGMTLEVNRHDTLLSTVRLTGDPAFLTKSAGEEAFRAANNPKKIVFCPPSATFKIKDHAAEEDIHQGLALSVECDEHPDPRVRSLRSYVEGLRRRCCCGPSPPSRRPTSGG
jgi:hypothetical protein